MAEKVQGIVKWFSGERGFGFIKAEDGKDVFVHVSAIQSEGQRTLNEKDKVAFILKEGKKGWQAEDVTCNDE